MIKEKKNLWQVYARVYDIIFLQFHPYRALIGKVLQSLNPQPGWRVLDAGCGTGNFLAALIKVEPLTEIFGVDYCEDMLKRAGEKFEKDSLLHLQKADLDGHLPFEADYFHAIVCSNVLYAVKKPEKLLQEFYRLLQEGGRLVLVTPPEKPGMSPIFKEHAAWLKGKAPYFWWFVIILQIIKLFPFLVTFLFINLLIKKETCFHFFKKDELFELLTTAGFSVEVMEKTYGGQAWFLKAQRKRQLEEAFVTEVTEEEQEWLKLS